MWTFYGESFGWHKDREGNLSVSLVAEWHELLPDMTGPSPDFEVDEVLKMNTRELSICIMGGGESAALREIYDEYHYLGKKLDLFDDVKFSSIFKLMGARLHLITFMNDKNLADIADGFMKFGHLSGPKYFWGRFDSRILIGPLLRSMGIQPDEKVDFLAGRLPGAIRNVPEVSFVSGRSLPAERDELSILAAMRDQF